MLSALITIAMLQDVSSQRILSRSATLDNSSRTKPSYSHHPIALKVKTNLSHDGLTQLTFRFDI